MTDERTSAYFDAMTSMKFALQKRNFRGALSDLRKGLRLTPVALEYMHAQWGGVPSIPFMDSTGGGLAALVNDEESFALMDIVNAIPIVSHRFEVDRYRLDAVVIQRVRQYLETTPTTSLKEFKLQFSTEDAARLVQLTNLMAKNGETQPHRGHRSANHSTLGLSFVHDCPLLNLGTAPR